MQHRRPCILFCVIAGVLALAGVGFRSPAEGGAPDEGPATIDEAARCAQSRQLQVYGYYPNGELGATCVVSEKPLSTVQRGDLWMHSPDFARWAGAAVISTGGRMMLEANFDPAFPERFALWGDLFIYGDPEVIQRLTAAGPDAS